MSNTAFRNNPLLRRAFTPITLTQEQAEEYKKCALDYKYFIKNYVYILNMDNGLQLFELRDYQERLVDTLDANRYVIVRMGRQSGKSESVMAYFLWCIIFTEFEQIAVCANIAKNSTALLSRLKRAYERLPMWLQQGVEEWNKTSIKLENGSEIMSFATSGDGVRSRSFTKIFLDEFGVLKPNLAEDFMDSTFPTISSGRTTKIFVVSTPKGLNHFYKMWVKAENGDSQFVPMHVPWNAVPGRDNAWREKEISNIGPVKFAQEYECSFVGSSYTLISGDKLKHMKEHYKDPVKEEQYGIKVFYPPEPDHKYLISVDTAEGKKLDYTAFVVMDITALPYRVVATYYSNEIDALLFPAIVYYAHRMYHEAELFIELNSTGQQVAQILWDEFATDNIIRVQTMGQKGQVLLSGASTPTKMQLGIKQSTKTKRLGCANLKTLIESDYLVVEAEEVIDELMRFVVDNQSYSAEEGAHDDLVMCLVNFGWLNGQSYFRRSQSGDVRTMLQEQKLGTSDTELMLLPAPMVTNGLEEPKRFFADGATWNEVVNSY